jgi:guanylate kinase
MTNVYIISAPSGSGKSTLVAKVREIVPRLDFSISYTTRQPRGNERNGVEYSFVSREEFDRMAKRGDFLEYAEVFGNCYGTAKRFLDEAKRRGNDLLLDIDVQGAAQIKAKIPDAVSIFILPPDRKTLEARLRHRSLDKEEVIQRRLVTARGEIVKYREYDYILINDRLEDSVEALRAILLSERLKGSGSTDAGMQAIAERCRLGNVGERLRPILDSFTTAVMPGGR